MDRHPASLICTNNSFVAAGSSSVSSVIPRLRIAFTGEKNGVARRGEEELTDRDGEVLPHQGRQAVLIFLGELEPKRFPGSLGISSHSRNSKGHVE